MTGGISGSRGGLDIVPRGWEHPQWAGSFYPEDLPPEWRLTYFANVFAAVLITPDAWLAAGPEGLARWAGDVPDRFRFYLELPPVGLSPAALDGAGSALSDRLAGLVAPGPSPLPLAGAAILLPADQAPPGSRVWLNADRAPPAQDLRGRRRWLQDLAARAPQGGLLVLSGDEAHPEALTRWWELAWLSGLA